MSGGSHEYVCWRDSDELFTIGTIKNLRDIADSLRALGHDVAASMVDHHADVIGACLQAVGDRQDRLADLLKAVEWHDSGDWGPKQVADAVKALVDDA